MGVSAPGHELPFLGRTMLQSADPAEHGLPPAMYVMTVVI